MGGRRLEASGGNGLEGRKANLPGPLVELIRMANSGEHVPVGRLASLVEDFAIEKQKHAALLGHVEESINAAYRQFPPAERAQFFAMIYDRFSERYDWHMETTGHFPAIRRILPFALPRLRLPVLDITAGTGEALLHSLDIMRDGRLLEGTALGSLAPGKGAPSSLTCPAFANEISQKMLGFAREKLSGRGVGFLNHDAMGLPDEFRGRFATVLCSQTFHLISDEDKARLAISIREALAPGGMAVVMEEDPFRITQTPQIEPVSMFLRAVVRPIKYPEKLAAYFIHNGFTRLEETAAAPIDSEHVMRLHIFSRD